MYTVKVLGSRIEGFGFRYSAQGSSFIFQESRCRVHASRSKFSVQAQGSRVKGIGSRLRVQGLRSRPRV